MTKIYILDTNVLLHDPMSLFAFEENEVVIPLVVIEELDKFKTNETEVGRNARTTIRILDELRQSGSLHKGIDLNNGGNLRIELNCSNSIPQNLNSSLPDNRIIGVAIASKNTVKNQVVVVSKDINMRVKCDALGVLSEDYKKDHVVANRDELYCGYVEVEVDDDTIDNFYSGLPVEGPTGLFPNEFVLLKGFTKSALAKYPGKNEPLKKLNNHKDAWGIIPKNKEQRFALDLLMDPKIPLVSLIGIAGSGKTLLSVAAGVHQTIEEPRLYNKLIISRPIQPMGKDLGYLPGSLAEKLNPWLAPLNDNLEFIFDDDINTLEMLKERGTIQAEALTYIRGRSIPKSFIIIDEAQNLNSHELKTILTRVGEGSKIVLTGDIEQIDSPYLDSVSNGLSIVVEKFKEYELSGHITLRAGVRSDLATLAAKIL